MGQGLGAALGIPLEQTARAEAERLYREATEANRLKDDFLATMSHEWRTPIAVILGFTELLQMDTVP